MKPFIAHHDPPPRASSRNATLALEASTAARGARIARSIEARRLMPTPSHAGALMRRLLDFALVLFVVVAAGCSNEEQAARSAPLHAPEGAEPGSYEDWCGEHEVPESLCTRCNPALIPAFQATGDWCAQHGLPKSQCRACNPELRIERPRPRPEED
jgi:hypothetical protein